MTGSEICDRLASRAGLSLYLDHSRWEVFPVLDHLTRALGEPERAHLAAWASTHVPEHVGHWFSLRPFVPEQPWLASI